MTKDWPVKWQTLETKARFIQQVMNGSTSVRNAEDIEGGALTYAEIKAIASGNPAVMEKVRVDTEVRKLDQLRSAHQNQQHKIRLEISSLPHQIARAKERLVRLEADLTTRDAGAGDDFTMTVGGNTFSGDDARKDAAAALTHAVMSWKDDLSVQPRAAFRGFEILSRGKGTLRLGDEAEERTPELFVRGATTYSANLNPENPVGTMQSIEHTLRSLDRLAVNEQEHIEKLEKQLGAFQAQANKPFEHEAKLKELAVRQQQLNAELDLDKGERQVTEDAKSEDVVPDGTSTSHAERVLLSRAERQRSR